jgi:hypothetical protein
MLSHEEMRSEEAARHDQFDGRDDIDADFEARCDDAAALADASADQPPMNDEDTWQAWLDLQSDPEYQADFLEPEGVEQ